MMQNKKLLIFIIVGCIFSISFLAHRNSIKNNSMPLAANTSLSMEEMLNTPLPVNIKIPSLNIDTFVEYVGLNSEGAMDIPQQPEDVAWFELGPSPGEPGNSVIAGHSGYKDNRPAVFDNLHKLVKGDKIYIEDSEGNTIIFVVRESKKYDAKADASRVFGSYDEKSHLNLITCTGDWNDEERTHSDRLVVFTDRE